MEEIDEETRRQIFGFWAKGIGYETVARTFGLPREVVRDVIDAEKTKEVHPFDEDPAEIVRDHCIRIDAMREDVAAVISKEKGPVRTRALRLQFDLAEHRLGLSQVLGVLPPPEAIHTWADGIQLANRMLDLLDREELLDDKLFDAITAEFATTRKQAG